jgi:hypothetical protein
MKKIITMILVIVMLASFTACNKNDQDKTKPTEPTTQATEPTDDSGNEELEIPTLSDLEYRLLSLFEVCPMDFPVMTSSISIENKEAIRKYLGISSTMDLEAVAYTEHADAAKAYSLVLVKVKQGADATMIANNIEEKIDRERWGANVADDFAITIVDDYIFVALMSSDFADQTTAKSTIDAFEVMMKNYTPPTINIEIEDSTEEDATIEPDDGAVG